MVIKDKKKADLKKNKRSIFLLEYCENKRLYGVQCFSTYWCNNVTAGLACSTWAPTTGMDLQMK